MMLLEIAHPYLVASVPVLAVSTLYGIFATTVKTADELAAQLDRDLQTALCEATDDLRWKWRTDEEALDVLAANGGRRHMLNQARLMFALAVQRGKENPGNSKLVDAMDAKVIQLSILLKRNWKYLILPQMNAKICIDLFANLCSDYEQLEVAAQWLPMS